MLPPDRHNSHVTPPHPNPQGTGAHEREALRMHDCFLGGTAPEDLIATYAAARARVLPERDALVEQVIECGADLRAVELALRRRDPANALTKRALLILSLAEARPEYFWRFVEHRPSRARAWTRLAVAVPRYLYQRTKGAAQLWWHGRHG